jgi:hypothetical protein
MAYMRISASIGMSYVSNELTRLGKVIGHVGMLTVSHRGADGATGAETLGEVVPEVVVAAGEISEDGIEVAGLLHAIPDARELIAEVLAAGVGGVEVALDRHADAAAHDAVAVTAAQGRLHARHALVRHALEEADIEAELIPLDRGA